MTPPRYIVEDQLVFVTCGAVGRSFRFLPVQAVVELLWFVLAAMVKKFGIAVHEVFFASNHFHIVLTDVEGNLPDFMRDLNSLISRGLNALRGTTGTNIEKGYNIVSVGDDLEAVEHCVYSLVNACAVQPTQVAPACPPASSSHSSARPSIQSSTTHSSALSSARRSNNARSCSAKNATPRATASSA